MKRWLKKNGCSFDEGTKHTIVRREGRFSTLPRHPKKEIRSGTAEAIVRQLGLESEWRKS